MPFWRMATKDAESKLGLYESLISQANTGWDKNWPLKKDKLDTQITVFSRLLS